jgi:hydroxyacylglutathione hydrolase
VIDPRRDASVYVEAAKQAGATIVAAIETHVHADFVSGGRELASAGVRVLAGPGAGLAYEHYEVRDDEVLAVGDLSLRFLHTPGHTYEHIAILAGAPGEPRRLFTGDLLFVGGVGRPDLVGEAQTRQLAIHLYDSLARVASMERDIEVHPGHGAGSLCGAGIGQEPSSTIGREIDQNPMLRFVTDRRGRDGFVDAVVADLPERPSYFARMKQFNLAPSLLGLVNGPPKLPSIRAAAAAALTADGATVIDLRAADAFTAAHPDGAINLAAGTKVGYWGGWVLPPDVPLLLLADERSQAQSAAVQLLRVGLDRLEGSIEGGFEAWSAASLPIAAIEQMPVEVLRERATDVQILDVRSAREWRAGHLPGSVNVPVGELPQRMGELARDRAIATICEGGYRSSLAASLLAQEGFARVLNVPGGMAAYRDRVETTT